MNPPPGFGIAPPAFTRAKSHTGTASPFTSPRPSPRMAFATPHIPHSPSLSAYQFSEGASPNNEYGDLAVSFYGMSQFCDPQGNLVGDYGSGDHEEVVVRDLDLDMIRQVRNAWQFYRDRRPESYTLIPKP